MTPQLTSEHYRAIAIHSNLEWLGNTPPPNNHTHTLWRCSQGHEFVMKYKSVHDGQRCPICKGINQRLRLRYPPEKYHELAKEKGITWLGDFPHVAGKPTTWRCIDGHEFKATYGAIRFEHGCPICKGIRQATRLRHSLDDYHKLAHTNNLVWVGVLPSKMQIKTEWECSIGHRFFMSYETITKGGACVKCRKAKKISKPQLAIHAMLGGELNYHTTRTGRYWIDIALDTDTLFPIAVEYDCAYWHNEEHDKKRDAWLIAHGWAILHIKSANLIPSLVDLQSAIELLRKGDKVAEIVLSDW